MATELIETKEKKTALIRLQKDLKDLNQERVRISERIKKLKNQINLVM